MLSIYLKYKCKNCRAERVKAIIDCLEKKYDAECTDCGVKMKLPEEQFRFLVRVALEELDTRIVELEQHIG